MNALLRQVTNFIIVGIGATGIHVLCAITFNGIGHIPPLRANFLAFLVASAVSYGGNWVWTFGRASRHRFSAPRFVGLSLACFGVNQAIVYGVVEILGQPLWLAMVPVAAVIPALGFWLSRTRVFVADSGNA